MRWFSTSLAFLAFLLFARESLSLKPYARTVPALRYITSFPFKKPAFITAHANPTRPNSFDLVISSFGVSFPGNNPDAVSFIPDIADAVARKTFEYRRIGEAVTWPNEVNLIDNQHLIVPGGFLVPGKKGHISMMDYDAFRMGNTSAQWVPMVTDDQGFYHRVQKINVYNQAARQGDSGERLVSCRGQKGVLDGGHGEMIFIEAIKDAAPAMAARRVSKGPQGQNGYRVQTIASGCDCYFTTVDYNKDGIPEFIIPAFFGKKLIYMWTEHPEGDYSKPEFIRQRIIDDQTGALFDVEAFDLDNDGVDEIVITNHQGRRASIPASVFAYKVKLPSDVSEDHQVVFASTSRNISEFMLQIEFERHTLFDQFDIINRSFMAAGPGSARVVRPHSDTRHPEYAFPVLIVSGDGSEKAHLLVRERGSDDWSYRHEIFHDCKGTVGAIMVEDIDNDGWQDVFVPCYDTNTVAVYTFAP